MYEGVFSLMQMAKTCAALAKHSEAGFLYISILTNPTMAGIMASFAGIGDIIMAEPGALVIFSGPRVMESRGFEVDENLIRSDYLCQISGDIYNKLNFFHDIRGIQDICARKDMKLGVSKYLELYSKTNYRPQKKRKKKMVDITTP